ncbi:MAG: hypothetical protein PARBA_02993 [Parabacteroides sp.]
MEEELGLVRKAFGGCLIMAILIIVGCVFPWALIFLIPYCLFRFIKHLNEKEQINQLIRNELQGKNLREIEKKRIELLSILQNPYATKAERDCAKYAIRYIEENYY